MKRLDDDMKRLDPDLAAQLAALNEKIRSLDKMLAEIADKHGLRDELDQRALANQDRAIGEAIESWRGPKL
jgi:hypothetical protein